MSSEDIRQALRQEGAVLAARAAVHGAVSKHRPSRGTAKEDLVAETLEDDPPKWLTEAIGRAPSRNKTGGPAVLAWRRAALAIDDYRRDHGWHAPDAALGPHPLAPAARRAYERAQRAVEQVRQERVRRRGLQRER